MRVSIARGPTACAQRLERGWQAGDPIAACEPVSVWALRLQPRLEGLGVVGPEMG
jgi:hypothetical protein